MLKLPRASASGLPTNRASGLVMLAGNGQAEVAAISNVRNGGQRHQSQNKTFHASNVLRGLGLLFGDLASTFSTSSEVSDSSGRTSCAGGSSAASRRMWRVWWIASIPMAAALNDVRVAISVSGARGRLGSWLPDVL